ncbi:MAG: hypothetical protein V3573_03305 [Desulfovibrionaceae bacterium]
MPKVRRMPGGSCRFFAAGRCLYDERLNPGYDESLQCRYFLLWEKEFDEFLDRAENFALGQGQAAELWERRFERLGKGETACKDYCYREDGGEQRCLNGYKHFCLLALPKCTGRCRHYESLREDDDNT